MMVDIFKKYKPSSWDVVKGDYGYTDEVPDYGELSPLFNRDDFLNNNVFSMNDVDTENKEIFSIQLAQAFVLPVKKEVMSYKMTQQTMQKHWTLIQESESVKLRKNF